MVSLNLTGSGPSLIEEPLAMKESWWAHPNYWGSSQAEIKVCGLSEILTTSIELLTTSKLNQKWGAVLKRPGESSHYDGDFSPCHLPPHPLPLFKLIVLCLTPLPPDCLHYSCLNQHKQALMLSRTHRWQPWLVEVLFLSSMCDKHSNVTSVSKTLS